MSNIPRFDDWIKTDTPANRLRGIAARRGIDPSIADDFAKVISLESGASHYNPDGSVKLGPRTKSGERAIGITQLMPGTAKQLGVDPYDEDQNLEGGLRYFAQGGSDPTARRLYFFGGPKAASHYKRSGQIPNVSDVNLTAKQYVQATGGTAQTPKPPKFDDWVAAGEPEEMPHHAAVQKRRVRNVATGRRGQFKSGQISYGEMRRTMEYAPPPSIADLRQSDNAIIQRLQESQTLSEPIQLEPGGKGFESPRRAAVRNRLQAERARSQAMQSEFSKNPMPAPPPAQAAQELEAATSAQFNADNEALIRRQALIAEFSPNDIAQIKTALSEMQGMGSVSRGLYTGSQRFGSGLLTKLAGLVELADPSIMTTTNNPGAVRATQQWLARYLRRQAVRGDVSVEEIEAQIPPDRKQQVADFAAHTVGSLAEIAGATTVAGPVGGFAGLGALEAQGQELPPAQVGLRALEEGLIGAGFAAAPMISTPAKTFAGRAANVARESAVIGSSTVGIKKAFGESDEGALQAAAANVLFHVGARGIPEAAALLDTAAARLKAPPPTQAEQTARSLGIEVTTPPGAPKPRIRPTAAQLEALQPTPDLGLTDLANSVAVRQRDIAAPSPQGGPTPKPPSRAVPSDIGTIAPDELTRIREQVELEGPGVPEGPGAKPKLHPILEGEPPPVSEATPKISARKSSTVMDRLKSAVQRPEPAEPEPITVTYNNREYIKRGDTWYLAGQEHVKASPKLSTRLESLADDGGEEVLNLITGKTMRRPGKKRGGFIDVREITDAIEELRKQYPLREDSELRAMLEKTRPYLFVPGVSRAEEAELMAADRRATRDQFEGSRRDAAESEYVRTLQAIRADFPNMTPDQARKWVADNRPELMARLEGDLGVQELGDVEAPRPKVPTAADVFARNRVQEADIDFTKGGTEGNLTPEQLLARKAERQRGEAPTIDLTARDIDAGSRQVPLKKVGDFVDHYGRRVVSYELKVDQGHPVGVDLRIDDKGTASVLVGRSDPEGGLITDVRDPVSMSAVLAAKRQILQQHPEIKKVQFYRGGTTGGERGRKRTLQVGKKGERGAVDLTEIREGIRRGKVKFDEALDQLRRKFVARGDDQLRRLLSRDDDQIIGLVDRTGAVQSRPDLFRDFEHDRTFGALAEANSEGRWRYEPMLQKVYWSHGEVRDIPLPYRKAVESYLARQGYKVREHTTLYDLFRDEKILRSLETIPLRAEVEQPPPPPLDLPTARRQLRQGAGELQRDYANLANHMARRQGLDIANEDTLRNYFSALDRFVRTHSPDRADLVARAEESAAKGDWATATLQSERALSGTHEYLSKVAGANLQIERLIKGKPATADWLPILREVQRRIGEVGRKFLKEEEGSVTLSSGKKRRKPYDVTRAPRKGRADTEAIGYIVDPIVEKLWARASQLISTNKLRGVDLKTWVREHVGAIIEGDSSKFGKLSDADKTGFTALAENFRTWHGQNRAAALAVAVRRLSQIAGEEPGAPKRAQAGPSREQFTKLMDRWKEWEAKTADELLTAAKSRFPESFNTDPEKAVDKLYQSVFKDIATGRRRAPTWYEEIQNRLRKMELAVDNAEAKARRPEPTPQQQAGTLKGETPPPVPEEPAPHIRAHWKALERTNRETGNEKEYEPETRAEWKSKASQLITDFGPDGAEEFLKTAKPGGVRMEVSKALSDYYQILAVQSNDPALLQKSIDLAEQRVTGLTETARELAAAKYDDKLTIPGALDEATRLYRQGQQNATVKLPPKIADKVNKAAVRRDAAKKKVAALEAKVAAEPESTPPPPPPRKPKLIKKVKDFLGGEGGFAVVKGTEQERILNEAKKRKAEAVKNFRAMEKQVGRFWTKASHPELEEARIELRDATRELLKTFAALEANNKGYYGNLNQLTRSLMVSGIATSSRNLQTQGIRTTVERLTDAVELTLRKVRGLESDLQYSDIWRNTARLVREQHRFADQILLEHPEQWAKMFGTYNADVMDVMPGELATGATKLFAKPHQLAHWLNTFNRMQEFHIRSAEFLAELELHTKKETGRTLEEFVAARGAEKLPKKLIEKAVDKALDVTFANNPPTDTQMGRAMNAFIRWANYLPPTVSPAAFPRFMYNNLKFLYQYNPVGGLAHIAHTKYQGGNVPRAVARWALGTSMFLFAYQFRKSDAAGEKWYEAHTPIGTVDLRPFGPFSTYLLMAEAARRYRAGERNLTFREVAEGLGASTSPGGLTLATVEKLYNYYDRGDFDRMYDFLAKEVGDVGRALLTPVRQIKDVVAQFDKQESTMRDTKNYPLTGGIRESIPFASRTLPPLYNPLAAEPRHQELPALKVATGYRTISPKNFLESEADRLHLRPNEIRTYTGLKNLDSATNKYMGQRSEEIAEKLRSDPRYQKATDTVKAVILNKQLNGLQSWALHQAAREFPDEYRQYRMRRIPYAERQLREERRQQQAP